MSGIYDIIVIGSGPGGYVAAVRAAQLGFRTAIVEREHLGGICLNWGCIPTKALLRSAEIKHLAEHIKEYGLKLEGSISADIKAIVARSRRVSGRLNNGINLLMKKNKINLIWGEAKLVRAATSGQLAKIIVGNSSKLAMEPQHPIPKEVLGEGIYEAKHIIVATGACPKTLPGMEPDGNLIWSYFEAMIPKTIPKSLVIVGSGAIGIEFASFYRSMGSEVTVIEVLAQIMPLEDAEISAFAHKQLEKRGIRILTRAQIDRVDKGGHFVTVYIEVDGKMQTISAERLISAVGVQGNIANIGLEILGVKTERGCIIVDEWGCTNVSGIYAIGDVTGPPMLAHKAEEEGVICIEKIVGLKTVRSLDKDKIPGCIYCMPQLASVGLTEAKAREIGYDIRIGRYSFAVNGKAIALGEDQGFVKIIFDKKNGQLLGAHMVGAEVTELIQGFVIAMNLETTEEELMHTVFPHPTLSEMMKESVLNAYGIALNA
ncbi:MAG: dihydrolipoamide dehydrogenase [Candidatus Tokpelaia sp. JSC188]|nr:MAG: dihydrolipoamide dehydrogenase [Candidatus Tokpelaia sp. JSC188]